MRVVANKRDFDSFERFPLNKCMFIKKLKSILPGASQKRPTLPQEKRPFSISSGWENLGQEGEDYLIDEAQLGRFNRLTLEPQILGVSSEAAEWQPDLATHNLYMSFLYVAALAANTRGSLRVFDFGGGMGQYAMILKGGYPELCIEYTIKEVHSICEAGKILAPGVQFLNETESPPDRFYDLSICSGTLQYLHRPFEALEGLLSSSKQLVYLARLYLNETKSDFVVRQSGDFFGLKNDLQFWSLDRASLLARCKERGYRLRREFLVEPNFDLEGVEIQVRSFLFERTT